MSESTIRESEFIMKDAYSFDTSEEGLDKEYQNMAKAYKKIFDRCGLETKMVQSDSGTIGGSVSHEFMVITDTDAGENDVFYCENCDYSANSNHAVSNLLKVQTDGAKYGYDKEQKLDTPNVKTIDELAKFLNITPDCILKSVLYIADSKPVLVMIRGDKEVEETKLLNAVNAIEIRPATSDEAYEYLGCEVGYLSFLNVDKNKVKIIFDKSAQGMKNFVIGANEPHKHIVGYNFAQINALNSQDLQAVNNQIYTFFRVDASLPNRKELLDKAVNYYKRYGNRVTTGNGYVDFLLFASVAATAIFIVMLVAINFF